jgi:uncharacterized protein
MLVGIMSDSHGRHLAVREAVEWFASRGVAHVIHCGDVGGRDVFDELLAMPCTFVWGNCDMPDGRTLGYVDSLGLNAPANVPTLVSLDGARFAVFHGHEPEFARAAETLDVDYLLHGHTHERRDLRVHGTRVINPGALHRARTKTVAILDTATDELAFHEIRAV